jgi:membrane-associated protein
MELIKGLFELIMHLDKYLNILIQDWGNWSYLLLFMIIFCETGLVVTPFLPGDSLLFAVGALCAIGSFNIAGIFITLSLAAMIGDTVNYALGNLFGEKIIAHGRGRFLNQEHIDRTHKFFERHGGKTIILARFVPIVRTFAPFVAGIGKMSYFKFAAYNITGALLWVAVFMTGGYYFGNMPVVQRNFFIVIIAIMLISLLPVLIEYWKHHKKRSGHTKKGVK